ncbi:hypothetical protein [Paraflavitalea speifideaquila]|uniref:hypothetical protein n=1 Tax=Paraflavitalea speifideaquila TaxID=3076558 RepID=UPI0028E4997E|nr:hypothetical protein [Paraflavitalea speifideiaquila]
MANKSERKGKKIPDSVVGALADAFENSTYTILRWFKEHDDRLTSDKARRVYEQHGFEYCPSVLESETLTSK